jgi:hypothetical protein
LAKPDLGGVTGWALTGVTALSLTGDTITTTNGGIPTGAGAATIVITETVCLGQTLLSGCAAANQATLTLTATYTGNASGTTDTFSIATSSSCGTSSGFGCIASGGGITFNNLLSAVVTDAVVLNHPADTVVGDSYALAFGSFTDPFVQGASTPEPSTFALFGVAFLGLLALGRLKYKAVL